MRETVAIDAGPIASGGHLVSIVGPGSAVDPAAIHAFELDPGQATCRSGSLIDFLAGRGKFVESSDGFTTDPTNVCHHE